MGLRERFGKLIGKEPEPISERERWRCAVIRNGNLDYSGKPIDRNAGGLIAGRPDLFTTDCIKERSQQQRTAEIADRQNKEVKADLFVVKMGKYQAECEED
jgi:hypothetical protein